MTQVGKRVNAAFYDIQIVRDTKVRGRKVIMVDGEYWGNIDSQSVGPAGNYYYFQQAGSGGSIHRAVSSGLKGRTARETQARVYGDKIAERRRRGDEPPLEPLDNRIMKEVRALIAEGLLRHPDVVKEEQAKHAAEWAARQKANEEEKRKTWEAKANEVMALIVFGAPPVATYDEIRAKIIETMEWAQTQ